MQGFERYLQAAATHFSSGNLKEAYSNYLHAAEDLLRKLSTEVVFEEKNRITLPPEYVQSLFSISTKCLRSAEDIVNNRCIYLPSSQLTAREEEDILDTPIPISLNTVTVEATLPLVPLSPLTQMSIMHSSSLASASQKLALAKRSKTPVGLPTLRRLTEDVRIQRGKLDSVNKNIQLVADMPITNWSPDSVAKQLTIIEAQLFAKISIRQDFLSTEPRRSRIQGCYDFHRYITNSITHQIIAGSEVSNSMTREYSRDFIISHTIRVAYLLLHVYRNFSGFAAIIKSLTSPEVKRLRKSWKKVPGKTKEMLKDLSRHVKEENRYRSYYEALSYKLDEVKESGPGLIAIPWIERHLEKLEEILKSDVGKSDSGSYLSDSEARKLEAMLLTLELCQGSHFNDKTMTERPMPPRRRTLIEIDGAKSPIALPSDLLDMGGTDLGLHHWLVSRVYLTRLQLWEESMEYEPSVFGELTPIFVKENGQALNEFQHMSPHFDTTRYEDVGQFNDYFTSESDHAPTNSDKMETVDEFLSYLDQDLVESSTPNASHLEDTVEETSCQHDNPWDEDIRTRKIDVTQALGIQHSSIDETVEEIFPNTQGFSVDSKPAAPDSLDDFNSVNANSPSSSISLGQLNGASEIVLQDSNASPSEVLVSESLPLETSNEIDSQLQESATFLIHENTLKSHLEMERIWAINEDSLEDCVQSIVSTDNIEKSHITHTDLALNMEGEPLSSITDSSGESMSFIISNGKRDHEDLSTAELIVSNGCQSHFNGVEKYLPSVNLLEDSLELHGKPSPLVLEKKRNIEANYSSDILLKLPLNSNEDVRSQQLPMNDNSQVNGREKANLPELDSRVQNQHENDLLPEIVNLDSNNSIDVPKQCSSDSNSPDTNYSTVSPLQGDKCALMSGISANQSNLNEASLAVPDIDDVDNSSEEEPRKFISLEKFIQLNGLDYVEEKSDGGSLNTITDDDVDTKLTAESEWDGFEFNCGGAVPFLHKVSIGDQYLADNILSKIQ